MTVARLLVGGIMGAASLAVCAQTAYMAPSSQQNSMTDTSVGGVSASKSQSGSPAAGGKTRAQVYQDLADSRDTASARRLEQLYRGAGN